MGSERKTMQPSDRRQALIVLDFGSQYSRLISRRVSGRPAYRKLVPARWGRQADTRLDKRTWRIFQGITVCPVQTDHLDPAPGTAPLRLPVWMSHGDSVDPLPEDFVVLASTDSTPVAAIANPQGLVGLQFHPEVTHTPQGKEIIRNFLFRICGCEPGWTANAVIEETVENIRQQAGRERVICGLSRA